MCDVSSSKDWTSYWGGLGMQSYFIALIKYRFTFISAAELNINDRTVQNSERIFFNLNVPNKKSEHICFSYIWS